MLRSELGCAACRLDPARTKASCAASYTQHPLRKESSQCPARVESAPLAGCRLHFHHSFEPHGDQPARRRAGPETLHGGKAGTGHRLQGEPSRGPGACLRNLRNLRLRWAARRGRARGASSSPPSGHTGRRRARHSTSTSHNERLLAPASWQGRHSPNRSRMQSPRKASRTIHPAAHGQVFARHVGLVSSAHEQDGLTLPSLLIPNSLLLLNEPNKQLENSFPGQCGRCRV